jgi:hypothetical protein
MLRLICKLWIVFLSIVVLLPIGVLIFIIYVLLVAPYNLAFYGRSGIDIRELASDIKDWLTLIWRDN